MILFFQTAFLGDLLLSIPSLKRLRQLYPKNPIHLVCRKGFGDFFVKNKICDNAFEVDKNRAKSFKELQANLSLNTYDLLVCPHFSFRSNLISKKVNAKTKIGFANMWNKLVFDKRIKRNLKLPDALRQMSLLSLIDSSLSDELANLKEESPFRSIPTWASMELLSYKNKEKFRTELISQIGWRATDKVVALAPGSVWPTKQWGVQKYGDLAKKLLAKGHKVMLLGSHKESCITNEIESLIADKNSIVNLAGKTSIEEMADSLAGSNLLVSNDSGAMHMAAAVDIPTVSIFGPTSVEQGYQPWNPRARVIDLALDCRPCGKHGAKVCPIRTHECMQGIPVNKVFRACTEILASEERGDVL